MRSSRWHAHGNVYIVHEGDGRGVDATGTDGVLEILAIDGDDITIGILNTDGSRAEMSGNGTRIAGAWLMERTGGDVARVHVGPLTVPVHRLASGEYESALGPVVVGEPELVDGIELTPVSVGNPHAVVFDDPARIAELGPLLETHPRFPQRTNVQVARRDGPGEATARVWERGVGETTASGSSAIAVAAASYGTGDVVVHFPGGDLHVRLDGDRAWLTGPAEPV
ncbi:MAG: diaminopimelate epimerase [Actinobacteria bacterium]|nr:diaminopimelate epimerase [Actinomycetota bacterium]MBV8563298.1 diaminopimelate epimerase [Actinomycetota bacterium]